MQQTRMTVFKRPLLWLGAALVVAAAVITEHPANHRLSYLRYVGPARLDGTRCTFLYPATLGHPVVSGAMYGGNSNGNGKRYEIQSVEVFSRVYAGETFVKRFKPSSLLRRAFPSSEEEIRIFSTDDTAQPDAFPTRPIRSENPRYIKSEGGEVGGGGHQIVLKDRLTCVKYEFTSFLPLPSTDAVVSQSFQVLPPGAALPMDTPKPQ